MSKTALVLGLVLVGSLAGNAVMFRRLKSGPVEARPSVAARPGEPASAHASGLPAPTDGSVAAELAALRHELADLKIRLAASAPVGSHPDAPVPVAAPDSARPAGWVTDVLIEQEQMDRFWSNIEKIGRATKGDTYRNALGEYTCDFLGLEEPARSNFLQMAAQASGALERAQAEYNEAVKSVKYDKANPQAYQQNQQEANRKYQEAQKAIQEQVKASVPQKTAIQKRFADQVQMWLGRMRGDGGNYYRSKSMEW